MRYANLGQTGIHVSELCFGILPMGPLQANIPVDDGAALLRRAIDNGVTFFDTAQSYQTYPHLRQAMNGLAPATADRLVVTSKSTAESYREMEQAVQEALRELGRDRIDIFLLHAARLREDPVLARPGAWQCLLDCRKKGLVRAIGASTHSVKAVRALTAHADVDVILPLYNKAGLGILDGGAAEMLAAVREAARAGKGLYSMKLLGGGLLLHDMLDALACGRALPEFAAHAVGMVRPAELELDLRLFNDQPVTAAELAQVKNHKTWTVMRGHCSGCGGCIERCPNDALAMSDGRPAVDESRCILCGYCAANCPRFAIRVK